MYYQLYVDSAHRVADLVAPLDAAALQTRTPACPDWTVHDVLAHLAGGAASFGTPSYAGIGSDGWANEHVESRQGVPVADLIAEREACAVKLSELAPDDFRGWLPVVHDALIHEADIRGTIGAPQLPADALAGAFPLLAAVLPMRLRALGPMTLELDGQPRSWGDGPPGLVVSATMFEFWRGMFGRRSKQQLRSWVVTGDAEAFAATLPTFGPRTTDLFEPA